MIGCLVLAFALCHPGYGYAGSYAYAAPVYYAPPPPVYYVPPPPVYVQPVYYQPAVRYARPYGCRHRC